MHAQITTNDATTFADLAFAAHDAGMGGKRAKTRYANGYGASVILTPFSYGGESGHYELAVLRFDGDESHLDYTTPITDDVLGHLSEADVTKTLGEIAALARESR